MSVSQGLSAKGEEKAGREDIPNEGEGNSLAHQSFEEVHFGWSMVLKDSDKSLPLIEERWQHLTVSVIYYTISYKYKIYILE